MSVRLRGYGRNINQPFGSAAYNGLNFVRSVRNRDSRLMRVLAYLATNHAASTMELRYYALHMPSGMQRRGWASQLFATAHKCGFIRLVESPVGQPPVWVLGPKAWAAFRSCP